MRRWIVEGHQPKWGDESGISEGIEGGTLGVIEGDDILRRPQQHADDAVAAGPGTADDAAVAVDDERVRTRAGKRCGKAHVLHVLDVRETH